MKTCSKCQIEKPKSDFYYMKKLCRSYSYCKPCSRACAKDRRSMPGASDIAKSYMQRWKELPGKKEDLATQQKAYRERPEIKTRKSVVAKGWRCIPSVRERIVTKQRAVRAQQKINAFQAYGGPVCFCCGEHEEKFLSIDHINGDGGKHRKQQGSGAILYAWLARHHFPTGFQVLCMNCNWGRRFTGICPHKQQELQQQEGVG